MFYNRINRISAFGFAVILLVSLILSPISFSLWSPDYAYAQETENPQEYNQVVVLPYTVTEFDNVIGQVVTTPIEKIVPGQTMMITVQDSVLASFGGFKELNITSALSAIPTGESQSEWFVVETNNKLPQTNVLPPLPSDVNLSLFFQVKYPYEESLTGFNWGDPSNFAQPPLITLVIPKPSQGSAIKTDSNGCQISNIFVFDEEKNSWTRQTVSIKSVTPNNDNTCDVVAQTEHFSRFAIGGVRTELGIVSNGKDTGKIGPSIRSFILSVGDDEGGFGARLDLEPTKIYTKIIEIDEPVTAILRLTHADVTKIERLALYLNLNGIQRDVTDSDTYIILEKNKPLQIVDPHDFLYNATSGTSIIGKNLKLMLGFTFAKPMPKSDIIIKTWDVDRNVSNKRYHDAIEVINPPTVSQESHIPIWFKNNAKWWAEGKINDLEFVNGLEYLIRHKIITTNPDALDANSTQIPIWLKNNAYWWAEDLISEKEFLDGIKWMMTNRIIVS